MSYIFFDISHIQGLKQGPPGWPDSRAEWGISLGLVEEGREREEERPGANTPLPYPRTDMHQGSLNVNQCVTRSPKASKQTYVFVLAVNYKIGDTLEAYSSIIGEIFHDLLLIQPASVSLV